MVKLKTKRILTILDVFFLPILWCNVVVEIIDCEYVLFGKKFPFDIIYLMPAFTLFSVIGLIGLWLDKKGWNSWKKVAQSITNT